MKLETAHFNEIIGKVHLLELVHRLEASAHTLKGVVADGLHHGVA